MSPGGPLPGLDTGLLLPLAITLMAMAAALIVGALVVQLPWHRARRPDTRQPPRIPGMNGPAA